MTYPEETEERPERQPILLERLLKSRTIYISGEVDEELAERVVTQALVLDAESHDPIKVFITTWGGSVDVGFAIHDIFRFLESDVLCIGAGFVVSMGVPLLLSAKKENRLALPNTRFMIHQPRLGSVAAGYASDIRITAQEIIKTRERLNEMIAKETGQPLEKVAADTDRDFWISAEEAKDYGLVARIITRVGDLA